MSDTDCRPLTAEEIATLEAAGSCAADWSSVKVADGFDPTRVVRCRFSGEVRLGRFTGAVAIDGGVEHPSGVYESALHHVRVGDEALVWRVGALADYEIGPGSLVWDVGRMVVEGRAAFGNGVEIEVLNEGGGRELAIYDRLTAQIAYLMVCYRHRPQLVKALRSLVNARLEERASETGTVGAKARVLRTASIVNVSIGAAASVDGAMLLADGTICSCAESPTTVGGGVVAEGFIIQAGSKVDGGAMLKNCFVGQACRIGRQFSAENSAFFANCEGFHGEACSFLGGPYTVSHHKSTLLIAALASFYNAGSGTNQSNHMYKLGPLHQGILERGSKTGSFSYLLWPCRVGPFTAVLGKHYANFDASEFPFSYINEDDGRSVLTPAMNLFTVGTRRDGDKWRARDRRTGEKLDHVVFDVLSPYTVSRMIRGGEEAVRLYNESPKELQHVRHKGILIKRLLLRASKKYYEVGIKKYLCGMVAGRLVGGAPPAQALAAPPDGAGEGEWVDLLGLLAPRGVVEKLCDSLEAGEIPDLAALEGSISRIAEAYGRYAWGWTVAAWRARAGKAPAEMSPAELAAVVTDWRDSTVKLNNMVLSDAHKEFDETTRIGFGVDGDAAVRDADFGSVRGKFEDNAFVASITRENDEVRKRAEAILASLGARAQ